MTHLIRLVSSDPPATFLIIAVPPAEALFAEERVPPHHARSPADATSPHGDCDRAETTPLDGRETPSSPPPAAATPGR